MKNKAMDEKEDKIRKINKIKIKEELNCAIYKLPKTRQISKNIYDINIYI